MFPSVRGLPATYWVLWFGTFINRIGTLVLTFLALYLTSHRGLSVKTAGLIVALHGAGSFAAALLGGWLSDIWGRRRVMTMSLACSGLFAFALSFARETSTIGAAAFLLALFGELYRPAVTASVTDVVPAADRARAFGLLHWVINLGFAISPAIAGLLTEHYFAQLFWVDAVTSLGFAALVWRYVPETRPAPGARAERQRVSLLIPLRHRAFLAFAVLCVANAWIVYQSTVALPLDIKAQGISAQHYGYMIGMNGVMIVVLQPFVLGLVLRHRRSHVLALSALLTGVGFGLPAFWSGVPAFLVGIAIWTMGEILMSPVAPAVVADLAPTHLRGSYQGVYSASWGAASLLGPLLGPVILERHGAHALWLVCLFVGVAAALGFLKLGALTNGNLPSPTS